MCGGRRCGRAGGHTDGGSALWEGRGVTGSTVGARQDTQGTLLDHAVETNMLASDLVVERIGLSDGGEGQNEGDVTKECEGNLAGFGGEHGGIM